MRPNSVEENECDLCKEVALAGTWVTGKTAKSRGFSRLIRRSSILDFVAGLGGLIPGYVLLVPRRHIRSMGELPLDQLLRVYRAAWGVAHRVKREFGGSIVIVEHGSSGDRTLLSGACVEHAHIHVFPIDDGVGPEDFVVEDGYPANDVRPLRLAARAEQNYYYCAWRPGQGFLSIDPKLGHQHARRVWAELIGKREEWDWAAAPYLPNALLTARRLTDSEPPAGSPAGEVELRETIETYDAAARWYAARTREYPATSSLPAQIDWLAGSTQGLILDAGSGAGRDALRFAETGRPVIALDASANLLRHTPDKPNVWRVVGDVRKLPVADSSIGAVWCSAVLLHLLRDDVLKALHEFFRVMMPDGLAVISVKAGAGHDTSTIAGRPGLRRHNFFYMQNDLSQLSRLAGFEVIRTWKEDETDASSTLLPWVKAVLRKPKLC